MLLGPALLLLAVITLGGNSYADDAPAIDEWFACWGIYQGWDDFWSDDKIGWGGNCKITAKCGGFANGSATVKYPVDGIFMRIDWAFEYFNPDNPSYTPTLCWGTVDFYPIETPKMTLGCGGDNPVKIAVDLSGCDWNWIPY